MGRKIRMILRILAIIPLEVTDDVQTKAAKAAAGFGKYPNGSKRQLHGQTGKPEGRTGSGRG